MEADDLLCSRNAALGVSGAATLRLGGRIRTESGLRWTRAVEDQSGAGENVAFSKGQLWLLALQEMKRTGGFSSPGLPG